MEKEIILFSTHCPRCKVLEMKLKQKNISYTECDNVDEMLKLGLRSAPGLSVDGKVLEFKDAIDWINAREA